MELFLPMIESLDKISVRTCIYWFSQKKYLKTYYIYFWMKFFSFFLPMIFFYCVESQMIQDTPPSFVRKVSPSALLSNQTCSCLKNECCYKSQDYCGDFCKASSCPANFPGVNNACNSQFPSNCACYLTDCNPTTVHCSGYVLCSNSTSECNGFNINGAFCFADGTSSSNVLVSGYKTCKIYSIFTPTVNPSNSPSDSPTQTPSYKPSDSPTQTPSYKPSDSPTQTPSYSPSDSPTQTPSYKPSDSPTKTPSYKPSFVPSDSPTQTPS